MRVSIIGAGLQCRRRAPVLIESDKDKLVSISSLRKDHAGKEARAFGCESDENWKETVSREDVDAVIICTPPSSHAEISIAAMENGKHVLCEKPFSMKVSEARKMLEVSTSTGRVLKCGFNHRHHPGVWEAKRRLDAGLIGQPLFSRCRYGICGRPDYQTEWRADPKQAAGGQFIEQGTHGIDLIRWFMGEIDEVACMTSTHFFKEQPMEDDGFAIFRTSVGGTASLHTSLVQWQNLFSFEVFCEDGYLRIEGLGGSYGPETLFFGKRDFNNPFEDQVTHYRGKDISWAKEWHEFASAISEKRQPLGNGYDGLQAMRIAESSYRSQAERKFIGIKENTT